MVKTIEWMWGALLVFLGLAFVSAAISAGWSTGHAIVWSFVGAWC